MDYLSIELSQNNVTVDLSYFKDISKSNTKINEHNEEQATDIFTEVYIGLKKAYIDNPHQNYDLTELVNSVVDKSSKKHKK